jgi:isopenicillin-N epimerase
MRIQDDSFWGIRRRSLMLAPGEAQLNAGTLSPTPRPVFEAVVRLRRRQAESPTDFIARQGPVLIQRSRARLATFLHADPADLLLIPNVTFALNIVAASVPLRRGDEVLMTDHEYGAMAACWRRTAKEAGAAVREFRLPYGAEDPDTIVDAFRFAIAPPTRVLFFSHVTCSTGLVIPAAAVCAMARRRGVTTVIDGAHAPGMVPVDLDRIGADFYGANCHKWLMSPIGCGFLHARRARKTLLRSIVTSWGWGYPTARREKDSGWGGSFWQRDFEFNGVSDRTPQMVLPEVLAFRRSLGGESAIARRVCSLLDYARSRLAGIGLVSATPLNPAMRGAMIAFEIPRRVARDLRERIWSRFRVETAVSEAAGRHYLRVSVGWFNRREEIDRLARALQAVLKM